MKRFLAVQHSSAEFLGTFEAPLEARAIGFHYVRPFLGQPLPASTLHYDALWLLGGPQAPCGAERPPWLGEELRLIAAFRRARRPVVGLGLGGLLVALACGGRALGAAPERAGFTRARRAPAAADDPLARAVEGRTVLVMVRGAVALAPGLAPLLEDEAGEWIAARPEELCYALLFRPELKAGMLEDMVLEEGRETPAHIGQLIERMRREGEELARTGEAALTALVAALDLMRERRKPPVIALRPARGGVRE